MMDPDHMPGGPFDDECWHDDAGLALRGLTAGAAMGLIVLTILAALLVRGAR